MLDIGVVIDTVNYTVPGIHTLLQDATHATQYFAMVDPRIQR